MTKQAEWEARRKANNLIYDAAVAALNLEGIDRAIVIEIMERCAGELRRQIAGVA